MLVRLYGYSPSGMKAAPEAVAKLVRRLDQSDLDLATACQQIAAVVPEGAQIEIVGDTICLKARWIRPALRLIRFTPVDSPAPAQEVA